MKKQVSTSIAKTLKQIEVKRGRVVAQVRNIFEKIDDATIYIPSFKDSYPTPALTISQ